ncbi:MAG: replicative DNA helicase [Bulleidia sp.]
MPRQMPSAPEAEASLLGTMMVYHDAARTAMEEGVSEDDFYIDANRRIFQAMVSLYNQGSPIDLTTVYTRLQDMNLLDQTGGIEYLTKLSDAAVTSANTLSYVKMIHNKHITRQMITAAEGIVNEGFAGAEDVDAFLDASEKAILDVSRNRKAGEFKTPQELVSSVLDNMRKMSENHSEITGLKTGFRELDHTLHGLQRGDMIVVAARPSMGKTAVSLNLALNVALYNKPGAVAIFSLEMAAEQLETRLLGARSHVPLEFLKTGRLSNDQWNSVNEAASDLSRSEIYIDDTPGIKMAEIFSKCRRLQAEKGLNLVLIDYIQLISGSGGRSSESRQQEVSEISRNLKALARELKVPVIALSQLSRTVEQRENKRPMLSDLRESGAIEQDADIVMMLYRESYYDEAAKEEADKTGSERLEINIAKHRNGAVRKVYLAFEAPTNALYNIQMNEQGA